jgi:MraZ protein
VLQQHGGGQLVMTVNNSRERCLWLYPLKEWEQVERKVVALPSFHPEAQNLKRLLIGYANDCEMDGNGRVRITPPLREFAGLDKRVVLIGQGNKFEIWDEDHWKIRCEEWLNMSIDSDLIAGELEKLSL